MTVVDMLKRWLVFSKYDPDDASAVISANPLVDTYQLKQLNKNIAEILDGYDRSGTLALIYAKNHFMWMAKNSKIPLIQILADPKSLASYTEIYDIFTSGDFEDIERGYLEGLDAVFSAILDTPLIGSMDPEVESENLHNAVDNVLSELTKCKLDVYSVGGPIVPVNNFAKSIKCFRLLSECLLTLSTCLDGIYLCYISANDTVDGYFGFFIKSNGSLISVNDRIDEDYPGEHSGARNNRYIENKKYALFPYDKIMKYSGSDYKGYATKATVSAQEYPIRDLDIDMVFSVVLAMRLLINKYENALPDVADVVYTNSMLPGNCESEYYKLGETCTALMTTGDNSIAIKHKEYSVNFTSEEILTGSIADRYSRKNEELRYYESGGFAPGANQLMVDLWGQGFELSTENLHDPTKFLRRIGTASGEAAVPVEFVGRKCRMDMAAYMQARLQLAQYMRDNIYEAYQKLGKDWAPNWWAEMLNTHKDKLQEIAIEAAMAYSPENRKELNAVEAKYCRMRVVFNEEHPSYWDSNIHVPTEHYMPKRLHRNVWKWICPVTGNTANSWILMEFEDWKQMETVFGEEVPTILKGYQKRGHDAHVNANINAYDPVEQVGTPFERDQLDPRYYRNGRVSCGSFGTGSDSDFDFTVAFGFSKRGLNKLIKQYKEAHK